MRHSSAGKKLGRVRKQRAALLRSQAKSLIIHNRIQTTEAKAKVLRPYVEKIITNAKKDTLSARRQIMSEIGSTEKVLTKLFTNHAKRYIDRNGGYTRIVKIPSKGGKNEAFIEFV
jgi:large subunit ribosomal protein L17